MLYIHFYISIHLDLFISALLCPYVNKVGGPNFSQQYDWLRLIILLTESDLPVTSIARNSSCWTW